MMGPMPDQRLRPIERRVLALKKAGVPDKEIAHRFRRGRRFMDQVEELANIDGRDAEKRHGRPGALRPVERRILAWRDCGMSTAEIAERFPRSPHFLSRVPPDAPFKLRQA